ncbi:MAG TPA: fatty acid desaturase [Polyangiales bacterium]|nr:fatty acid desaturase [Polyangiales bacterium]
MQVTDPRLAPEPIYADLIAPLLNDRRDAVFVGLMVQCALFAASGVVLFFVLGVNPWFAPVYWAAQFALLIDRFTLMLHCTSHRALFKPRYAALNNIIPWVLCPFFGQSPNTYFAHHMGMHHAEENLEFDLSSTMRFRRDSLLHWMSYWLRFLCFGLIELSQYFRRRNRTRLMWRTIVGEATFWLTVGVLLAYRPGATLAVLLGPFLIMRTLMMMGNWAQHAFIDPNAAASAYGSSITCINSRYNRRCWNDGYHIGHHLKARAHWTEYPVEFERNVEQYGREGAIVFEGIDFFIVWLLLMTGSWGRLADAYVQLPGAPQRSREQIITLLKQRVQHPVPYPAREALSGAAMSEQAV